MEHIPIEGDDAPRQTPEERESRWIASIVIPANADQPLRQERIDATDLDVYQDLVSGHIELVILDRPPASLYCNSDGKDLRLPLNRRATLLLWAHQPAIRYRDFIAGDVFLTGPPGRHGWDTDTPESYLATLLRATRFRIEVQTHGDPTWYGNEQRFTEWADAYSHALDLGQRWSAIEDLRIVPEA